MQEFCCETVWSVLWMHFFVFRHRSYMYIPCLLGSESWLRCRRILSCAQACATGLLWGGADFGLFGVQQESWMGCMYITHFSRISMLLLEFAWYITTIVIGYRGYILSQMGIYNHGCSNLKPQLQPPKGRKVWSQEQLGEPPAIDGQDSPKKCGMVKKGRFHLPWIITIESSWIILVPHKFVGGKLTMSGKTEGSPHWGAWIQTTSTRRGCWPHSYASRLGLGARNMGRVQSQLGFILLSQQPIYYSQRKQRKSLYFRVTELLEVPAKIVTAMSGTAMNEVADFEGSLAQKFGFSSLQLSRGGRGLGGAGAAWNPISGSNPLPLAMCHVSVSLVIASYWM